MCLCACPKFTTYGAHAELRIYELLMVKTQLEKLLKLEKLSYAIFPNIQNYIIMSSKLLWLFFVYLQQHLVINDTCFA